MGLAGYYRDFIPNFATIAAILSDLTRKVQPSKVEWGDTHEKAYQTIKILLTIDPILRLPDPEKTFVLRTEIRLRDWCSFDTRAFSSLEKFLDHCTLCI